MSLFKDVFPKEIQQQLQTRQNLLNRRSPTDLQYINTRKAWVRMTSGVNIDNSSDLASKYILQGGVLDNGKLKFGLDKKLSDAYSLITPSGTTHRLGIRPMPGIVDVDIKSKSAYGSLREATISFTCWDLKQLEDLELLFMRPGFTVLLEWGWIPFLGEQKVNGIYDDTKLQTSANFFDLFNISSNFQGDLTLQNIYKELHSRSLRHSCNYDALIGYIKNYSWNMRGDGGYDCKTVIISFGEVIESLKINYGIPNISLINKISGFTGNDTLIDPDYKDVEKGLPSFYDKNILAGLLFELFSISASKYKDDKNARTNGVAFSVEDKGLGSIIDHYNLFLKEIELKGKEDNKTFNFDNLQVYITLESLCNLINNHVLLKNKNESIVSISTFDRQYYNTELQPLLCLAHPLQLSVDPAVCLITNPIWSNGFKIPIKQDQNQGVTPEDIGAQYHSVNDEKAAKAFMDFILDNIIENQGIFSDIPQKLIIFNINKYLDGAFDKLAALKELLRQYEIRVQIGPEQTINETPFRAFSIADTKGTKIQGPNFTPFPVFLDRTSDISLEKIVREQFKGNKDLSTAISIVNNTKGIGYIDSKINNSKFEEESTKNLEASKEGLKFLKEIEKNGNNYFLDNDPLTGLAVIGNIYINLNYLYKLSLNEGLQSSDRTEKNDINLYDYLKQLMKEVQGDIGNINNFEIHVDPIDNKARIIDINYTNNKSTDDIFNKAFIVECQGLKSIVKNLTLQSQIFPEQSTIVAISAQNGGGQIGLDNTTLLGFNKNITDRIIPERKTESENKTKNIDPSQQLGNIAKNISSLTNFFVDLKSFYENGLIWDTKNISEFNTSKAGEYKNALKDFIFFVKNLYNDPNKFKAIIPTKLSLTIDGIGGLIIGNIFRIQEDVLPRGYKGEGVGRRLGYIVTSLQHRIDYNSWDTTIDAQTIILEEPEKNTQFDYNQIFITDPTTKETIITPISTGQISSIPKVSSEGAVKSNIEPITDNLGIEKGAKLLILAQAQREGFYPGSRSFRNNNPGNLVDSPLLRTQFQGQIEPPNINGDQRFAKFNTLELGIRAKYDYLKRIKNGENKAYPKNPTLQKYMNIYAPSNDGNNVEGYINYIIGYFQTAGYTISRNTTFEEIFTIK